MAQAHEHEPAPPSPPAAPPPQDVAAWVRLLMRWQRTRKVVLHAPGRARGPRPRQG